MNATPPLADPPRHQPAQLQGGQRLDGTPCSAVEDAERKLDAYIAEHCICRHCMWVTDRPASGMVTCKHPEGALIDGIPHVDTTTCECHDFSDLVMDAELKTLMDDWYSKAEADGQFDLPNVTVEPCGREPRSDNSPT